MTIAHVVVKTTKNLTNNNDSNPDINKVDDTLDSNSDAPIENQKHGESRESSPSPSRIRIKSETTKSPHTNEPSDSEGSNIEPGN